jgi:endonuclease-3
MENTTRENATQSLARFKDEFYDWNDIRVSPVEQIQNALSGLPDPEARAFRIRRFLRQLFQKTFGFSLDDLAKKPLKEAIKTLREYEAIESEYVLATTIQLGLGGHAIPIDNNTRRILERLEIAESNTDTASLRGMLERAIPKNRGLEFVELMQELAYEVYKADDPERVLRKVFPGIKPLERPAKAKAQATKQVAPAPPAPKSSRAKPAPKQAAKPAAEPSARTTKGKAAAKAKPAPKKVRKK